MSNDHFMLGFQRLVAWSTLMLSFTVPMAAQNRIEKAATPFAFSSFRIINAPGSNPINLHGDITLASNSDGLNPAAERLVFVLGASVAVLEPGSLKPSG